MSILTDTTLQKIQNAIETKNGYLRELVDLYAHDTWDTVAANVKAGKAPILYQIGDEMICNYKIGNTVYQFPWVVVDNNRTVVWNDGTEHPGLILQAKFATVEAIQFDAAESTNVDSATEPTAVDGWFYWGVTGDTYTALNLSAGDTIPFASYTSVKKCGIDNVSALRYGYNRYRDSAIRQWLNSDEEKGDWWTSTHLGDIAPAELNSYDGFLRGLDSDFLAVINPVKVQVATNTVTDGGVTDTMYDKFWLPSVEEMYGSPQAAGVEGAYFPYWKTKTGLNSPSNSANAGRIINGLDAQTTARSCRLRSANRGGAASAWIVNTSGECNYYYSAFSSIRSEPACAIS